MDLDTLRRRNCTPGSPLLPPERVADHAGLLPAWTVPGGRRLRRELRLPDFAAALAAVNAIGRLAEQQGHHPDLELGWGRVAVAFTTHDAGGLTEADFIMAARIDTLYPP